MCVKSVTTLLGKKWKTQKAGRPFWEKSKKLNNVLKKRYGLLGKKVQNWKMCVKSVTALLGKKSKKKKGWESRFPYCFLANFTKLFLWGSTLLDFGFLTEEASWIHRIFKIWCHDKKNNKNSKSSEIWRSPPILTKFGIKHHSVFVDLRTKFQLKNKICLS